LNTSSILQRRTTSEPAISNSPALEQVSSMERILIIEDDSAIQRALKRLFESEGYYVDAARDGTAGLELFRNALPSVLVLDLRLPGRSGEEVCREIKQLAPDLPLIVLSGKSDVVDKVLLLEIGADDYVTKPFSPRELLARVRAAMRRSRRTNPGDLFLFDDVTVSLSKMEVTRNGESVGFTAQEFKTLKFMLQNAERVVSREELLNGSPRESDKAPDF
jgi:two-component system, OmpR family, alkaline phosphatase synthesis response regulator PhoP